MNSFYCAGTLNKWIFVYHAGETEKLISEIDLPPGESTKADSDSFSENGNLAIFISANRL